MLKVQIEDGKGRGRRAVVSEEGQMEVVVHPHPPTAEEIAAIPFRQYFTDNGNSTGSNDMRVDGGTTPTDFYIEAGNDFDTYVKTIAIVIADVNASLNTFGNIAALTNGVEFSWVTADKGTVIIHEGLQTNFDFVRLAVGQPSFGSTTNAFRASNISGSSEGYIPTVDFSITFGLPWGLRLRKDSTDRLVFKVQDNVTAIDAFNVIGYGIQT